MKTQIGKREYEVDVPWNGKPLDLPGACSFVSLDTEFTVQEPHQIVLAGYASIHQQGLLYPDQIEPFIAAHPQAVWVFHHVACDWPLIDLLLSPASQEQWRVAVDEDRVRCTMLLDMLLRLARGDVAIKQQGDQEADSPVPPRKLEALTRDYTALHKESDDPYRLRYHEILGHDFRDVDPGFLHYASHDPIVTLRVYLEQQQVAADLMARHGWSPHARRGYDIRPDAVRRWGYLSEVIQVQGALALQAVEQLGIGVDRDKVEAIEKALRTEIEALEADLVANHKDVLPRVYGPKCKKNVPGARPRTENGCLSLTGLAAKLGKIAVDLKLETVPKSGGKLGGISKSAKDWIKYADKHPFLATWTALVKKAKLLSFLADMKGVDRVHPKYNVIVTTGRTSCYGPNIQQQPKDQREHFVPAKGYKLWVGDLSGAELCTFAAFARAAYGFSVMGDQLEQGRNVHAFFASKIMGIDYDEFLKLKKTDPDTFAKKRQIAKPANFGLMGGMGPAAFARYASAPPYNVPLTEKGAEQLIRQWEDTFPEGKLHRGSAPEHRCLARNLGCRLDEVSNWLADKEGWYLYVVERVLAGEKKKSGEEYSPWLQKEIWGDVLSLARFPDLREQIDAMRPSPSLSRRVFRRDVAILTGRLVGGVRYTVLRNYPFQGLAGDIKVAIWQLVRRRFRVVAFVHDELLVEVRDQDEGAAVARIVKEGMESVMGHNMPATVEWHVTDCWKKP